MFTNSVPMTVAATADRRFRCARPFTLFLVGSVMIGLAMVSSFAIGAHAEQVVSRDVFDKWMSICTQAAAASKKACFAAQSVSVKQGDHSARLIEVQLKPIQDVKDSMSLVVNLPLGIYLPANAKMQIDSGREINLTVLTCTQNGCLSAAKVGQDVVTAMRKGKEVTVGFIPQGSDKTSLIKLPLDGFDKALSAALKMR